MAQAGLFVPAKSFNFTPFNVIMTRIVGNDSLEKSQSSFIFELDEIRPIVMRSTEISKILVLSDELCRGTETDSATALNYALITYLLETKTFFIGTSHLHDLAKELVDVLNIEIFHIPFSTFFFNYLIF